MDSLRSISTREQGIDSVVSGAARAISAAVGRAFTYDTTVRLYKSIRVSVLSVRKAALIAELRHVLVVSASFLIPIAAGVPSVLTAVKKCESSASCSACEGECETYIHKFSSGCNVIAERVRTRVLVERVRKRGSVSG